MSTTDKTITIPYPNWQTALLNGIVISGMLLGWTWAAQSQPIADDTLGNENSIVVPLDSNTPGDRIEGGARRGDNLFHSLQKLNVDPGRSVYFSDPGVNNIITRVTGGTSSQIDGVLGVGGNANLFLINPNGIIFGANARLDVGGSFTATTASAIEFNNQGDFSATNPTAVPLLTVQPSAFLFNQMNPAPIANNSRTPAEVNLSGTPAFGLRVPQGKSLTLLGGNISMDGGGVNALGGRVEIGGLGAPGTVTLNADGSLNFGIGVARADVSLTNQARINVIDVSTGGGSITANASNFEIKNSFLFAGIADNSGSFGAQAGDITLNASAIRGESAVIANVIGSNGIGNSGDIKLFADFLSLTDDSNIQATILGQGDAGSVVIKAGTGATIDRSLIFSNVGGVDRSTVAVGNGGEIQITTPWLLLTNGSQLQSITLGQGNAGNVIINASDRVMLNNSAIFSTAGASNANTVAVGNGGDIQITTPVLSLTNGSLLTADTFGQGDAGNVILDARERANFNRSDIFSDVNPGAEGDGGNIEITTPVLSLTNGSLLAAGTFGQGDAGNVILDARERATFNRSGIFSDVNPGAEGDGGNIEITTPVLSLTNGSLLTAGTSGQGDAGNVILAVRERVSLEAASSVNANTNSTSAGRGGTIQITTEQLQVFDGAAIAVNSQGSGVAGNIDITSAQVQLNDSSRLSAETATVNGGNITLSNVELLQLRNSSLISTTAGTEKAGGNGGNIDIDSELVFAILNENSDIRANAFTGSGGSVRIKTQGLFGIAFQAQDNPFTSDITASSEQGLQGNVNILLPDVDPRSGLTQLPEEVIDVSNRIAQGCRGSNGVRQERNEFIVKGRGGLPPSPTDSLIGDESLVNWLTLEQTSEQATSTTITAPEPKTAALIVEAQGWIADSNGKVTLIANAPANAARPPLICQRQANK